LIEVVPASEMLANEHNLPVEFLDEFAPQNLHERALGYLILGVVARGSSIIHA
jgi:hypothetical protein